MLKAAVPIRIFSEWDERRPGFLEIDLVAQCGTTVEGFYLNTLSAVEIAAGWVYVNFFQPALQLQAKHRVGARVHKTYDTARTPYRRLLESEALCPEQKTELRETYARLNPAQLKREMECALSQLWALARVERRAPSVTSPSEATIPLG